MPRARSASLAPLAQALSEAAIDGFAQIEAPGLGVRLRKAATMAQGLDIPTSVSDQFASFVSALERFEERGRQDRSQVVGHGLRLCATLRALGIERSKPRGKAKADIDDPLAGIPKVGPATRAKLREAGFHSLEDLAAWVPVAYEDTARLPEFYAVEEGVKSWVRGQVLTFKQSWFRGRYSARSSIVADTPAGPREIELRWFHPVGALSERLGEGTSIALIGEVRRYRERWSVVHPELLDPAATVGLSCRYAAIEGLAPASVRRICRAALARWAQRPAPERLPSEVLDRHRFPTRSQALRFLHDPPADLSADDYVALCGRASLAHRRLAFDEHFELQLALARQRQNYRSRGTPLAPVQSDAFQREALRACLPFEPTRAQWRVIEEAAADLAGTQPMLRLLQGDVGSGKTVVAFALAAALAGVGGQTAIMAPTEILAEQHRQTLAGWCAIAGLRLAHLSGSTPRPQRRSTLALLEAGQIDIVVGTHALLAETLRFARLGLVIIDEQHRFGVDQREILRQKGGAPHLLVMSATPIPRSLALTAYGELDISVLDEMPPGREPSETVVYGGDQGLHDARTAVCERVQASERAFVVCPLIESSEFVAATDVEQTAQDFRMRLPHHKIGVVHGRMLPRDKQQVLDEFRTGSISIVVATTVIEVGVDVPEAGVMLVEHAERFGLAQMHQLRGRVGRGGGSSVCLLHSSSGRGTDAYERLRVMEREHDGFKIAEFDLQLRGPGEIAGTRQSGSSRMSFMTFTPEGLRLVEEARDAARRALEADPDLGAGAGEVAMPS